MNNILVTTSSFSVNKFPDGFNVIYNPYKRKLTENELYDLIDQYQPVGMIAGVEPITRNALQHAKYLKVISRCGVGTDSLDMAAAEEFGIKVTITPCSPVKSVAELTLALILCMLRKINTLDAKIRSGGWKGPQGNLLCGKVVGVIGCGRIGTYVAQLLQAFGCNVIGYDPYITQHPICNIVEFNELIKQSEIITLHIPYNKESHHIIDREELQNMKKNAILINAARGGLVNEEALYEALTQGVISGAAIDCYEKEPYDGPLKMLDNTLLIPHMGSSAYEARIAMEEEAIDNLAIALKGE